MFKKTARLPSISLEEANAISGEPKETVRPMEWVAKLTSSTPQWLEFVSVCKVKSEIREDVFFHCQYRQSASIVDGAARISKPEIFSAAIRVGSERILALDTNSTPHTNKVGKGLPLYRHTLRCRTHLHIWTDEGYGYAEPIDPPLESIESLVERFIALANLKLTGSFVHPLTGRQLDIF